jgi:hypothetical protein
VSRTADTETRNGVDTAALFATLDAAKGNSESANFHFRVSNKWISGTHNPSTDHGFYGAMPAIERGGIAERQRSKRVCEKFLREKRDGGDATLAGFLR